MILGMGVDLVDVSRIEAIIFRWNERFLKRIFTTFFFWTNPDSRVAKPRCMMNTKTVETSIQILLAVNSA